MGLIENYVLQMFVKRGREEEEKSRLQIYFKKEEEKTGMERSREDKIAGRVEP